MTDRGGAAEAARVCPFVALDDDRDRRLDHPDHRHRCFAEGRPEPRALAHQEAFCLSPSFPGCPVFQDWARREAARPATPGSVPVAAASTATPAAREPSPEDAILAAGAGAAAGAAATAGPLAGSDVADVPPGPWDGWTSDPDDARAEPGAIPPRRAQRRDWAAPPPWRGDEPRADRTAGQPVDRGAEPAPEAPPPAFLAERGPGPEARPAEAAGLAGAAASAPRPPLPPEPEPGYDEFEDDAYAPRADRRGRRGSIAAGRVRGDAPPWERPRRSESYPALKNPMTLPRLGPLAAALAVLVIAALALFFVVPALLVPGTNPGAAVSPSPSAGSSAAASVAPATPAAPTPQVYVIKQGDTLSKIAKKFGITIDELLAANTTTIKDPNKIGLGQQIIIPVPGESPEASPAPSASPSA